MVIAFAFETGVFAHIVLAKIDIDPAHGTEEVLVNALLRKTDRSNVEGFKFVLINVQQCHRAHRRLSCNRLTYTTSLSRHHTDKRVADGLRARHEDKFAKAVDGNLIQPRKGQTLDVEAVEIREEAHEPLCHDLPIRRQVTSFKVSDHGVARVSTSRVSLAVALAGKPFELTQPAAAATHLVVSPPSNEFAELILSTLRPKRPEHLFLQVVGDALLELCVQAARPVVRFLLCAHVVAHGVDVDALLVVKFDPPTTLDFLHQRIKGKVF